MRTETGRRNPRPERVRVRGRVKEAVSFGGLGRMWARRVTGLSVHVTAAPQRRGERTGRPEGKHSAQSTALGRGWSSWPGARLARIQGSGRGQNAQAGVGTGQGRDHRTCLQNRPGGRMTDVEELLSSGTLPPGGKSFDPNGLRLDFIPHFMYSTCRLERFAACN